MGTVTLDPYALEPLYAQLAALLRNLIERGKLTGRVSSTKTLAQEHDVPVGTAARALAILREEA